MPDAAAKLQATWAEDRAPVRTDPSADLGAKTEERAAVQQAAARPSHLRDWRQCAKPSRHDAANVPTRRPSKVANDNRPEFHFPLNQHSSTRSCKVARRHHVDVLPYLTDVLRRLPGVTHRDTPPDPAAIDEFLPDRWAEAHPEHVLTARIEESREAQARRRYRRTARRLVAK